MIRSGRTSKKADDPDFFSLSAEIVIRIPYRASACLSCLFHTVFGIVTVNVCVWNNRRCAKHHPDGLYHSRCCVVFVLLYFGYVVRIQSHFSNILTELWSSILKTFDPLPGGSFNNNSVILQLGSRRYPISEMDLAKQGLEP